ncbi:MAG: hypothetical protein JXR75_02025 [Rhodobacteraceae bacterium]|nr:hypothetical protein [Paracoccaceae bacterium]
MAVSRIAPFDPDAPLAALRQALTRLDALDLEPDARAALKAAWSAFGALDLPQGPVDNSVFAALLAMAGPEVAPELLTQMAADLRAVGHVLTPAMRAHDWAAICAQSHVLVALAGAAGATGLAALAQALNRAAHRADDRAVDQVAGRISGALQQLISFVEQAQSDVPQAGA